VPVVHESSDSAPWPPTLKSTSVLGTGLPFASSAVAVAVMFWPTVVDVLSTASVDVAGETEPGVNVSVLGESRSGLAGVRPVPISVPPIVPCRMTCSAVESVIVTWQVPSVPVVHCASDRPALPVTVKSTVWLGSLLPYSSIAVAVAVIVWPAWTDVWSTVSVDCAVETAVASKCSVTGEPVGVTCCVPTVMSAVCGPETFEV